MVDAISGMSVREKAAHLIMVEFTGGDADPVVELLGSTPIGGVLLKSANGNLVSPKQTVDLIGAIQAAAPVPLLIAVDQEGGRVDRVRFDEVVRFPSARVLGILNDESLTEQAAWATGTQLRALGFNLDFAPVADVNVLGDANPAIGERSFGDDPELVAAHVRAAVAGFQRSGILAAVKHFPGHGNTSVDSHFGLPIVQTSEEDWAQTDLVPFVAVAPQVPMVMVAHVAFPELDPAGLPATLSAAITGRLRAIFDGVIVTDDLGNMGAVAGFEVGERAVLSLLAGADLLLNPGDPNLAVESIAAAVESGRLPEERLDESVRRVLDLRRNAVPAPGWPPSAWDEVAAIAARIADACDDVDLDC